MKPILAVVINGELHLEYHRDRPLPDAQRAYLDRMDREMDRGVSLDGERIPAPDPMQRARFVAVNLVQALHADDEAVAAATCSWLAERLPELQQVRARLDEQGLAVELVFDRAYAPETTIQFVRPDKPRDPH